MDEKNITSYGSGANNTEEQKSQEKPKLVKIPVEEALFEFDGFEFEEVKRSGNGAASSASAESKEAQASKLEESLKKDADLVAKLSELHGIPAKGNAAEKKAEEKSDASEEKKAEESEENTSVVSETNEPETENEQDVQTENEDENTVSIEPETEETAENSENDSKTDGSYEADPVISDDEAYKAYSETVEEVSPVQQNDAETDSAAEAEVSEQEVSEEEESAKEEETAETSVVAEEPEKTEVSEIAEDAEKAEVAEEIENPEASEESEKSEVTDEKEESEVTEAPVVLAVTEETENAENSGEQESEEAESAEDEEDSENAENEEKTEETEEEPSISEAESAENSDEVTENNDAEGSEEEVSAETVNEDAAENESEDQAEAKTEDENPATALPSQSKEEKTQMAAQITASFTGKADEGDSRQVTFLDIINGEPENEENGAAESETDAQGDVSDETVVAEAEAETAETENAEAPKASEESETETSYEPEAPETEAEENNAEEPVEASDVKEDAPEREEIWDEADREMVAAKKRYLEYCRTLTVPPLKITKDTAFEKKKEKAVQSSHAGSGYQYEMVERLPLFADGIHGGTETEGYRERERQYCDKREEKKGARLGSKARSYYRRNIFAAVLMVTMLIFENINLFFGKAPDLLLTRDNVIMFTAIELAMLMIGAILIFDSIVDGIAAIFKGMIIPETLSAGLTIASIAYHIGLLLYPALPEKAVLLGSPVALAMLLTLLYKYNMTNRAITAFGIASSYGEYTTEVKIKDLPSTPEGRAFKGMVPKSAKLYKMNKVARIDGCYTNRSNRDECFGILRKLSLTVFCAAVVSGLVFGLLMSSIYYGVLSAYLMLMLASPVGIFISLYYPRIRCAKAAADAGAAVIGYDDESDEFEKAVIMIDDGEIFPAEDLKIVEFVVSQTPDMEMQLSRICGLFTKLGGPVDKVFKNMKPGLTACGNIEFAEIAEKGVCAWIDGKFVVAGSESYLAKYGAAVERYDHPMAQNARVMYIAEDGEFIARIIMEFNADADLCEKLAKHRHTATVFSLKTCNPCIDEELVFDTTGIEPDFLKVVKYNAGDDVMPLETDREGILVSRTGLKGLLAAMLEYKRQKRLVHIGCKFAIVSCVIGAAVALMLAAIGNVIGYLSLASMVIAGALALFSAFAASRSAINTKSKKKKD